MRPIDADRLKAVLEKNFGHTGGASVLEQLIDEQPTIEPSTNCSEIPNSSDTISRQAAIDALDKRFDNIPMEQTAEILKLRKDLRELPTIQPVATDTNVGDTISRQAAIDALAKQMPRAFTPDGSHPADEQIFQAQEVYVDCITTIELLPTVQPEPKEGHWIEGGIYRDVIECYCSECGQIMTTVATVRMNYCPRCGADMRGEQHETD